MTAVLTSIAVLGLVSACSDDPKLTVPTTIASDVSIPAQVIDQMITQLEESGMKVDRPCFENLLKDQELRKLVTSSGAPSAEIIQKFIACLNA